MKQRLWLYKLIKITPLMLGLTSCYKPPYNDFHAQPAPSALHHASTATLINQLNEQSVQVVRYHHVMTVIVPTDKFYVFDTAEINDIQYAALNNIVRLIESVPHHKIYIAGFNDNVGSKDHKRHLSDQRAKAMAAFLWAYGFDVFCLDAAGYADKNDIADNRLIHGSAMNRRVEIQWRI